MKEKCLCCKVLNNPQFTFVRQYCQCFEEEEEKIDCYLLLLDFHDFYDVQLLVLGSCFHSH